MYNLKYYLLLFFLIVSGLIVVSDKFHLINLTSQVKELEDNLSEKLRAGVIIDGKVTLKFLPTPHIEVIGLKIFDNNKLVFSSDNLSLKVHPNIILGLSNLHNIDVEMKNASVQVTDFKTYWGFTQDDFNINLKIDKVNLDINVKDLIQTNFDVNNLLLTTTNGKLFTEGKLQLENDDLKCSLEISHGKNISLSLNNMGGQFNIDLNNFDNRRFAIDSGKVRVKINDIDSVLPFIIDNYKSHNGQITDKVLQNNFELYGELLTDVNGEIVLSNIITNSNFIDNLNIDLRLYKVLDDIIETHLSMSLEKVDLSNMKNIVMSDVTINDIFQKFFSPSKISDYTNFNLNFNFKKIILTDGEASNLNLSLYSLMRKMIVDEAQITLPGNGHLDFQGLVASNDFRKKIIGQVHLESSDDVAFINWYSGLDRKYYGRNTNKLTFKSNVFAIQNLFRLGDYIVESGDEYATGNIYLYDIPYEAPIRRIIVNGSNINFDHLGFIDQWDQYLTALHVADLDKSGEEYFKLTGANRWIRSINKNLHLNLNLDNSIIRGEKIPNIKAVIDINPSNLNIYHLDFSHEKIDGNFKFSFHLPILRPQIKSELNFSKIDLNYLEKLLVPKLDKSDKINFFSANNYDANVTFKIDNLILDNGNRAMWVNGQSSLRFGSIFIPKVQYSMWNGQIQATAEIGIASSKPVFISAFSIYNIDPQYIFSDITGIDKITGYMSLAGTAKGNLETIDDLKKINGKIDFMGAQMLWKGLNLNKIIEIVDNNYTASSKLKGIEYYSQYGETKFDILKGTMTVSNGLVSIDSAEINDKRFAGLFSVNYDLASKILNGASTFAFIPINENKPLNISMKTDGNIANSNSTVDYSEIEQFINSSGKK